MILKSPQDRNNYSKNLLFTSSARLAWQYLLEQIKPDQHYSILLPSYIGYTDREGSGVFDPVETTKTNYGFYPLNEQLAIDVNVFEEMIKRHNYKLALVIHYFGFCQNDLSEIANICKTNNVLLVEDCAHAFQIGLKNQVLGNVGDFSFYSLHKYFALNEGGILQINNQTYSFNPILENHKPSLETLEQYIKSDVETIAEKRRSNFELYNSLLSNIGGIEIMYELSENDIPHNFPIKVKNDKREKLYFYLMDRNAPTIALYYRLIDQIKKSEFPLAFKVSNEILNLPVHQDTDSEDIQLISALIKEFFKI